MADGNRRQPGGVCLLQLDQVVLPVLLASIVEFPEVIPGVDARIVAVVEDDAYRIVAHRFKLLDPDVSLSGLQYAFGFRMAANLRRWRKHAQEFCAQYRRRVAVVDLQGLRVAVVGNGDGIHNVFTDSKDVAREIPILGDIGKSGVDILGVYVHGATAATGSFEGDLVQQAL